MKTSALIAISALALALTSHHPACAEARPITLPDAPSFLLEQQQTTLPATQQPATVPGETEAERRARIHAEADRDVKVQETQRIAVVVPNFNTVISGRAVPLSPGQKTDLALHATFDPFNFVGAAFNAGVSELNGSHRGFGWGPAGYAKRYGANLADVFTGTMLAGAVYPILLRQDPRFFRQGTGTLRSRIRHALLASVICRGDSGRRQPNYSNVLGNFSAGLISNLYYPSEDTGIGLSLVNSSIQTAEGAAGNIALEFSPDIGAYLRRYRGRRKKNQTPTPATAPVPTAPEPLAPAAAPPTTAAPPAP